MRARTRNVLTLASLAYIAAVGYSFTLLPIGAFNLLLVTVVVPLVWLVLAFCHWSAHQHAGRWARDIQKVHRNREQYEGARR